MPANDTMRVHVLNKLGKIYRSIDGKKARTYIQPSIELGQKLNFYQGVAEAYNVLAMICDYEGNYPEAERNYHAAIAMGTRSPDKLKVAKLWDNLGGLYSRMSKFDSGLAAYDRSMKIKEILGDKKGIALTLDQVANVYNAQGRYPMALEHYLRSLKIREDLPDNKKLLGTSYLHLAIVYAQIKNDTEALSYYARALDIQKEEKNTEELLAIYLNRSFLYVNMQRYEDALADNKAALEILNNSTNIAALVNCYNSMGSIHKALKNTDEAIKYYKLALPLAIEMEDRYMMATLNNSLGEMAAVKKNYAEALKYLATGHENAVAAGVLEYIKENYLAYADVYNGMNDHRNAYKYYKLYSETKDSILNKDNNEVIAEMKTRYETEKKEKEILQLTSARQKQQLLLNERNRQLTLFIGLFVMVIGVGGWLYNRNHLKQKARLDIAIANTETVRMQTILETEQAERKRIAKDLHDELGSGISRIVLSNEQAKKHINGNVSLNNTLHNIDRTVTELAGNMNSLIWALQVEHVTLDNLFARMREFASDFFDDSPIEPVLDLQNITDVMPMNKEELKDLYLVYKEALNNAMKYSKASQIHINASLNEDMLHISIQDNGVGMNTGNEQRMGNGINNMRHRVEKHGGRFQIAGGPGGTHIQIAVPFIPATSRA
ncbi:hypothetical protein GCM10023093_28000 [Nemorincola caseinilytica]|uniref:Histidine kinase domain-containing protein n=1 Tax=Nemorincola caseinilytica TaxID=2054315 RepID=A0ABP8NQ00_9BACT